MKKTAIFVLIMLLLCGCGGTHGETDSFMKLRSAVLLSNGCQFDAEITADYGDKIYAFSMACQSDKNGNISFEVKEPSHISGITGEIAYQGGKLIFEDLALAFPLQTDELFSPVSAPWVMMKALRDGYVENGITEGEWTRVSVYDSYQDEALRLDIWMDQKNVPVQADIYEENRRILTVVLKSFQLL